MLSRSISAIQKRNNVGLRMDDERKYIHQNEIYRTFQSSDRARTMIADNTEV